MPKSENFNPETQNPEVGPVLPNVDPSVLVVPNQAAVMPETGAESAESAETVAAETVATETVVAEPKAEEATQATETAKPTKSTADKKSRKDKTQKHKLTKAEKANRKPEVVSAVSEDQQAKPLHEAKPSRARSNLFVTVLVVISLIMSCVSLTYCIWDFIRSDVMAIIDHFNSATEESAPESTPTVPEAISITLDNDTAYHGVAIIDQDATSGVTLLKFQNVDNLPITSDQQVIVINKSTTNDTIQFTIVRDNEKRTVNITLDGRNN